MARIKVGSWGAGFFLAFLLGLEANAADVDTFGIIKRQRYISLANGTLDVDTNRPFEFEAFVAAFTSAGVVNASLMHPNGSRKILTRHARLTDLSFEDPFITQADMNLAYPPGEYTLSMTTQNDGTLSPRLTLLEGDFPNTPRVLNLRELQAIDPHQPVLIQWFPMQSTNIEAVVELDFFDESGAIIYDPGVRHPASSSFTVPAGIFQPSSNYTGRLAFHAVASSDKQSYPGAIGAVIYSRETRFPLKVMPKSDGRLRLLSPAYNEGTFSMGISGVSGRRYQVQSSGQTFNWVERLITNAPATIFRVSIPGDPAIQKEFFRVVELQ